MGLTVVWHGIYSAVSVGGVKSSYVQRLKRKYKISTTDFVVG